MTGLQRVRPLEPRACERCGRGYRAQSDSPRTTCSRCERKAAHERRDARARAALGVTTTCDLCGHERRKDGLHLMHGKRVRDCVQMDVCPDCTGAKS